ncbi:MAG TPA: hypothetical protein VI299_27230 [Polyangiales bacterium]
MTTKAEVDLDLGNINATLDLGLDDVNVDLGLDDINVAANAAVNAAVNLGLDKINANASVNARAELGTKSELTTHSDFGAKAEIGARADLGAKAEVNAKVDLGLDDIKAKVSTELIAAVRELAPMVFQFLWKEIPLVRVAMPHRYKLGFNVFGHELASLTFCGESELVTEDYRKAGGGHGGP